MSKTYNKKYHLREFSVGDLVLCENPKNQQNRAQKGKFEPNWLGHFINTVVFGSGAYLLSTPKVDQLPNPINVLHLKKLYPWCPFLLGASVHIYGSWKKNSKKWYIPKIIKNYKRKKKRK